jgi:hypothetical protein
VTAHHRDDQVETILLKLLRGVHLSNLRGMEVCPLEPNEFGARVLRPLLNLASKEDLRRFSEAWRHPWLEDPSNASNKYKRNQVRHELVPLMEQLTHGGALHGRLSSLEKQSTQLRAWLDREATAFEEQHDLDLKRRNKFNPRAESVDESTEVLLLPVKPWASLPAPVRSEVLHRLLSRKQMVSAPQLERVETKILAHLNSSGGSGGGGGVSEDHHHHPVSSKSLEWELHLPGSQFVARSGAVLRFGSLKKKKKKTTTGSTSEEKAETRVFRTARGTSLEVSASPTLPLPLSAFSVEEGLSEEEEEEEEGEEEGASSSSSSSSSSGTSILVPIGADLEVGTIFTRKKLA